MMVGCPMGSRVVGLRATRVNDPAGSSPYEKTWALRRVADCHHTHTIVTRALPHATPHPAHKRTHLRLLLLLLLLCRRGPCTADWDCPLGTSGGGGLELYC